LAPDQILRYGRTSYSSTSEPLFVSAFNIPTNEDIPRCPLCKSDRTFEFQVLPQILNLLCMDDTSKNALDFGTILVYTCEQNCDTNGVYLTEFLWRQDFSNDGIQLVK